MLFAANLSDFAHLYRATNGQQFAAPFMRHRSIFIVHSNHHNSTSFYAHDACHAAPATTQSLPGCNYRTLLP
jgi:hypothetical protein